THRQIESTADDDEVLAEGEDHQRRRTFEQGQIPRRFAVGGADERQSHQHDREYGQHGAGAVPECRKQRPAWSSRGGLGHRPALLLRAYNATAAISTTPRTTSLKNESTPNSSKIVSRVARMRTPPILPATPPRPPARIVPPNTAAAMDSRSYPPSVPTHGAPAPSLLARNNPASPAATEHNTCASTTIRSVRMPENRATSSPPPTA